MDSYQGGCNEEEEDGEEEQADGDTEIARINKKCIHYIKWQQ
jgi:hypothetical protein